MALLYILFIFMQCQCLFGFLFLDEHSGGSVHINVQTNVGEVVGKLTESHFEGKRYKIREFLGVPYAEPPVGDKRFRKPVPRAPFTSPFDAFDFGNSCLQEQDNHLPKSEDCLFLNIYVPHRVGLSQPKLPVMVWIHGGGFQHGSSANYPGDVLCHFGQVIVVTLNYRLAHIGFLPTLNGIGNYGLWDQHLAIKWTHDNIAAFDGDTNRITIFGESAGSSSVVYQTLYPGNKGLFHRAIAESGGITSPWAFDTNTTAFEVFQSFSEATGCRGSYDQIMVCLRNKTSDEMATVMMHAHLPYIHPNKDNGFVPKNPFEMLTASPDLNKSMEFFYDLDFMMGSNSIDGALYLGGFAADLNITDIDHLNISRLVYEKHLIPSKLSKAFNNFTHVPESVKEAAILEYTDWSDPDDYMARNKMLTQFMTDHGMIAPMVATGELHSLGRSGRTYLYEFSVRPGTHLIDVPLWLDGPTQANHGDEIFFVFGYSDRIVNSIRKFNSAYNVTNEDILVSKAVMTMWTNFAKSG